MFYFHLPKIYRCFTCIVGAKQELSEPRNRAETAKTKFRTGRKLRLPLSPSPPAIQCVSDVINFENNLNLNLFSINFFLIPSTYIFLYNYFLKNKFSYIKIGDKYLIIK